MTIGEFSRRSQLSLKALRLYERLGLLRPVAVDPGNGYRRYHESQLYTARLIIMLRLLDMPLSEVGRVVSASGAEAAELIDAYWVSAERRFTAQRQVMASLRPGVAVSQMPAPELLVRERDVGEQTVLTEQRHVYVGQLAWIREAAARLTATAARCGGVAGERFVIFHGIVTADSDGPVEVCVPVLHPPEDPAELAWRVEAAHREAFIPVARAHFEIPAILSIYDQLARWVSAHGRRQAGAPREVYPARCRAALRSGRPADLRCRYAFRCHAASSGRVGDAGHEPLRSFPPESAGQRGWCRRVWWCSRW
jgi:DNA-binding transcriptional MerR regulator